MYVEGQSAQKPTAFVLKPGYILMNLLIASFALAVGVCRLYDTSERWQSPLYSTFHSEKYERRNKFFFVVVDHITVNLYET